jgi:hypothetical protein
MMSRRTRILLALVGLALVVASLAALSFAWAPVDVLSEQTPLAPTLFTLPPGGGP